MFSEYLGVKHPGCAAVLRKLSKAPRTWFDTENAACILRTLRDLADRAGTRQAVDDALAIILASA